MIKNFAIIPAAGSGSRLGGAIPKAFQPIAGKPMVQWVIDKLLQVPSLDTIVLAVPENFSSDWITLSANQRRVQITTGGHTRQESVALSLQFLAERHSPAAESVVLIHDAARCLVSIDLIERCLTAAITHHAITAAISMIDSVNHRESGDRLGTVVPRESLVRIQTPQVFRFDLIHSAHKKAEAAFTDDASLVRPLHAVKIVEGDESNWKVTTPYDFAQAEQLLRAYSN